MLAHVKAIIKDVDWLWKTSVPSPEKEGLFLRFGELDS